MLDRQPPSNAAITICVEAWHDLSTERPVGFGALGRIPWRAVKAWAEDNGLDRDNRGRLWVVIQQLDAAWFEREHSKARNRSGGKA